MSEKTSKALPDKETVLMDENVLLQGLIEAGNFRNDESLQRKVEIRRKGKLLFTFTVRPIDEEEEGICRSKATKKYPNPNGRKLPAIEGQTDWVKFRSWKIYMSTIDEDKALLWDNPKMKQALDVLQGVDLIDKVLRTGEKDAICTIIEEISGGAIDDSVADDYGDSVEPVSLEEYAKN